MSDYWRKMVLGCPGRGLYSRYDHPWQALTNQTARMTLWCPVCGSVKDVVEEPHE